MGTLIKIVWPHIFLGGIAFWAVRTQWFWTWTLVTENRFLTGALAILRGSAPKVLDIGGIHTLDYPLVIKHRNGQSTICSWFSQSTSIFIGGFQTNHFWYHGCSRLMVGGEPKGQFLQKKHKLWNRKTPWFSPKHFFPLMADASILMCHFRDTHGTAGPEVAFVNDVGLSTLGALSPSQQSSSGCKTPQWVDDFFFRGFCLLPLYIGDYPWTGHPVPESCGRTEGLAATIGWFNPKKWPTFLTVMVLCPWSGSVHLG